MDYSILLVSLPTYFSKTRPPLKLPVRVTIRSIIGEGGGNAVGGLMNFFKANIFEKGTSLYYVDVLKDYF